MGKFEKNRQKLSGLVLATDYKGFKINETGNNK